VIYLDDLLLNFKKSLEQEAKSINTIDDYVRHIKNYFKWCSQSFDERPVQLYRQNILEYKSYLQNVKKVSVKTINNKLSALIKYNKFMVDLHVQENVVITDKDYIKIQKDLASPCKIDKKTVEIFRQKVLQEEGSRNYAIVTIMAYAGLRISEVLNLKNEDVDLKAREIKVTSGKGSKYRIVYINDKIIEAVKEYEKARSKDISIDYLFISNRGRKLDRTVINKMTQKYSDIITPHMLRHFYCSNAIESGYSIHEVANQAGHSNVNTTLIYTNPSRSKMKEKANLL
jgi:site-specific recombinase XerD